MPPTENPIADRAPLLPIAIALILGIALAPIVLAHSPFSTLHSPLLLSPLLLVVLLVILLRKRPVLHTLAIYLATFVAGALLASLAQKDHHYKATMQAVVISEPSEKARTIGVQILLVPHGQTVSAYLRKDDRSRLLQPGDGIRIQGRIQAGFHRTLSCFVEADKWQKEQVSLRELSIVDRTRITFLKWRHLLLARYQIDEMNEEGYAVLAAMTLGDKSALTKELRDTYSVTGASHILALSGLHLGILYMLLSTLMLQRGSHRKRILVQVILVLAIWAFALLVGLPVSVVRSALMISIFALFTLGHRPHLSVNLLALAAIIILVISPTAIYDIGFQLSFLSVLSILMFMPLFARKRQNVIVGCLWVSLAAQLGTAPLVAYYFGRFSTYFLLTNLVVLPLAYIILVGALLTLLVPAAGPVLFWVVDLLNTFLRQIAKLPMASLEGLHPSVVQVFLCYVVILCLYGAFKRITPKASLPKSY